MSFLSYALRMSWSSVLRKFLAELASASAASPLSWVKTRSWRFFQRENQPSVARKSWSPARCAKDSAFWLNMRPFTGMFLDLGNLNHVRSAISTSESFPSRLRLKLPRFSAWSLILASSLMRDCSVPRLILSCSAALRWLVPCFKSLSLSKITTFSFHVKLVRFVGAILHEWNTTTNVCKQVWLWLLAKVSLKQPHLQ